MWELISMIPIPTEWAFAIFFLFECLCLMAQSWHCHFIVSEMCSNSFVFCLIVSVCQKTEWTVIISIVIVSQSVFKLPWCPFWGFWRNLMIDYFNEIYILNRTGDDGWSDGILESIFRRASFARSAQDCGSFDLNASKSKYFNQNYLYRNGTLPNGKRYDKVYLCKIQNLSIAKPKRVVNIHFQYGKISQTNL